MHAAVKTHPVKGAEAKKLPGYDPELLFVECSRCGRPVLWEPGRATAMISHAGVRLSLVDDHCMILSDGCPACSRQQAFFQTRVVRLRGASLARELLDSGFMGLA